MDGAARHTNRARRSVRSAARSDGRRASGGALVVCLERADAPIRVLEYRRVLSNVLLARVHAAETRVHGAARLGVDVTSPISAEGVSEDESLTASVVFYRVCSYFHSPDP